MKKSEFKNLNKAELDDLCVDFLVRILPDFKGNTALAMDHLSESHNLSPAERLYVLKHYKHALFNRRRFVVLMIVFCMISCSILLSVAGLLQWMPQEWCMTAVIAGCVGVVMSIFILSLTK